MKKTAMIFLLIIPLIVWILPSQTFAYSFTGDRMCNYYYVPIRWGGSINEEYKTTAATSMRDWNEAQNKRRFVQGDSSSSGVIDAYYSSSDSYFGYSYWQTGMDSCTDAWVTKINTYYESNNDTDFGRSVVSHELGHILGLAHTNWSSLMNTDRNRYTLYTPQKDDINGVNELYK